MLHEVHAVLEDERLWLDAKKPGPLSLGEELALAVKYAHQVRSGRSDEVYPICGSPALRELRKLAAVCVRALERHGPPVRAMGGAPGTPARVYTPGTREEAYAAIDSELDYLDERGRLAFSLAEAGERVIAAALDALAHWSNQPSEASETMARVRLRTLGALCVRALELHGAEWREPDPLPPPPTYRDGWKAGKNPHVIAFVEEAEGSFSKLSPGRWADLRDRIDALKRGEATLDAPQSFDDWAKAPNDHH